MQNDSPITIGQTAPIQPTSQAPPQDSQSVSAFNYPAPTAAHTPLSLKSQHKLWPWLIAAAVALVLIIGAVIVFLTRKHTPQASLGQFNTVQLPLDSLEGLRPISTDATSSLKVNGQLDLSGSFVLNPSLRPQNPTAGEMYYDQALKQLMIYDGQQFVSIGTTIGATTNVTNITNNSSSTNIFGGGGNPIQLQGSSPGQQQTGNFNVSGTGQVGTLNTPAITSFGSLTINPANALQVNASSIGLATAASSGATGSISITTGNSSTTASGNITLDTGTGIIDGEVVEDKTFESGVDQMQNWFNTTIAPSTEQAHSGLQSLKMTPSSNFWGIIEILPGTPVTPGHQYHFSMWVRAATIGSGVGGAVVWPGSGGVATSFTSAVDNTTGWTELSLTAPAPAGATSVYFQIQSNSGTAGAAHYFDDITITDLSSSSAFSSIDIGTTNAKVVTIGNMNQIGATSIMSSSGVTLNGGAGNLTMIGGTVSLTGNGASTISTTNGALTIISAGPANWGVGTSTTGAGDTLTLHGGTGAFGNNNGGDLILKGGDATGIGLPGVVVLSNSHFRSTQTTPPTIAAPTNCGTGATAAVTAGSTDSAGSFTITTGTGGTSSTCDTVLTFNKAYTAAPKSIIVTGKTDAPSSARQIYVSASNTTTFTSLFGNSAAGADNTTYSFNYWIVE